MTNNMNKTESAKMNKMFYNFEGVLNSMKTLAEDNSDHTFTLSELRDWDLMFTDRNMYEHIIILFRDANLIFKCGETETGEDKYALPIF